MAGQEPLESLPLQPLHEELGARLGEFAGWRMPLWYGGAVNEVKAVRQTAGMFDISHMGRYRVEGAGADEALSTAFSRDFSRVSPGKSIYALACNAAGGIIDDLMVYRLADEDFVVICNAANAPVVGDILTSAAKERGLQLRDLQGQSVLLAVQGPEAVARVAGLVSETVRDVPRRGCAELTSGEDSYFLARTGYTGEDGFEIMTSAKAGAALLKGLADAGCTPCGLAARDTLRLEASLPLYELDIDETTTPWEAGLGWALDLEHEFTGSKALRQLRGTEERRLACLIGEGAGVLRSHQPVYADGEQVSETTSGGFSPTLDRSIAMAYLPVPLAQPETTLEVEARGKRIPCRVVPRPFYRSAGRSQKP